MTAEPQSEAERVARLSDEEYAKWLKKIKPQNLWQIEYDCRRRGTGASGS